jgi:TRAP-type C4-dicarboxylate transport system permease small subunit
MVFVALIVVFFIYIALVYLWTAAQPQINSATPVLETLRHTFLGVPQETALAILKWALILVAFYVITDALMSALRRNPNSKSSRMVKKDAEHDAASSHRKSRGNLSS